MFRVAHAYIMKNEHVATPPAGLLHFLRGAHAYRDEVCVATPSPIDLRPRPACSPFCAGRLCSWGKLSTKEFARWPNLSYPNCAVMHWQSDEDYRKLCRYTNTFIQSAPSAWRQSLLNYFNQKAITTTLLANIGFAHIDLAFASCKYE